MDERQIVLHEEAIVEDVHEVLYGYLGRELGPDVDAEGAAEEQQPQRHVGHEDAPRQLRIHRMYQMMSSKIDQSLKQIAKRAAIQRVEQQREEAHGVGEAADEELAEYLDHAIAAMPLIVLASVEVDPRVGAGDAPAVEQQRAEHIIARFSSRSRRLDATTRRSSLSSVSKLTGPMPRSLKK
ncbi:unnamed protein product [Trichogramma brassicae]|uniref:Uncharacterized protein n=1 Tax=Trichogramma brassicae TaxID=86971 RepID=A0A6H5ILT0_9HYME|nr:unnamed protein product [Trichogramma brassicae]